MEYVYCEESIDQYFQIKDYLISNNYIQDAVYVIDDKTVLIAVQTKPIFSKKIKDELISTIANKIAESFDLDEVLITFDTDLFYRVKKCQVTQDKEEIKQLINTAKVRR